MITLYRLFFPFVFLFFLPGLIVKLIRRSGKKNNYPERFGIFSEEKKKALRAVQGAVWIHAVSVGETNVALTLLKQWVKEDPGRKFVFSTTTTTAQEIAFQKVPAGVEVIFCPVDFCLFVRKTLNLIHPSAIVILETELWPNLILTAKKLGVKLFLVNGRLSDHSVKGYRKFRAFFAPVLQAFDRLCVQTPVDAERFSSVADVHPVVTGNIKFDQSPNPDEKMDLTPYFGRDFVTVLACSTHAPEEKVMLEAYRKAAQESGVRLKFVIVPRHAERGNELETMLKESGISYYRKTSGLPVEKEVECLLADTTGELVKFIVSSDLILMGKTFAGNTEGQNIIEPAVLGKAIITGSEMSNFRQAFSALKESKGVLSLAGDDLLADAVKELASSPEKRSELGNNAREGMKKHSGALSKTIQELKAVL